MAKRKWTEEEIKGIITSYNQGVTFKELQEEFNAHYYTLKQVLDKYNVDTSGKRVWGNKDIKDIVRLYTEESYTVPKLRDKYRCRTQTILDILNNNGVNTSENARKSVNRQLHHEYFDLIDTEEKAYFLGMLMADGCVRQHKEWTPTITLELIDLDVIEKFKRAVNADSTITKSTRDRWENENPTYTIVVRSAQMVKALHKHGVVKNKTYITSSLHRTIPPELSQHYLRGLVDGDGSLYNSNGRWFLAITNGHVSFLEDVQDWLQNLVPTLGRVKTYDGKTVARITYSGKTAKKVCEALYSDSTIHMNRKKKLANKLVEDIV